MAVATDPDLLTGADFEALYETTIKPELQVLEERRGKAMTFLKVVGGIGLALVIVINTIKSSGPEGMLMLAGLAMCVISVLPLFKLGAEAKEKIVGALCVPLGMTFDAKGGEPEVFSRFKALNLMPHYDSSSFEDRFLGTRKGCDFELFEASLDAGSGKDSKTVFRGQLISVAFPTKFLGTTVVLRDGGWFNRFQRPKGLERVTLEDPVFEKVFEVCGNDQVESRFILTPDFMEKLLALETAFEGNNLRCAFSEGRVYIAVEGKDRFEIGDVFKTLVDYRRVQSILSDLGAVFSLIDSFVGRGART